MDALTLIPEIRECTDLLNYYRDRYYNHGDSPASDAVYDRLYDRLKILEEQAGFHFANSPTQTVGYAPVSGLEKVRHAEPLLSLEKEKAPENVLRFMGGLPVLAMHKLDGLTVKLEYEGGCLRRASTRGDGHIGEDVTHNARAIAGIPYTIPCQAPLVVSGEAYIKTDKFQTLQLEMEASGKEAPKTARNLAAGSIRLFDPAECRRRGLEFVPFRVLEGLPGNSKFQHLNELNNMGFSLCEIDIISPDASLTPEMLLKRFEAMKSSATEANIPIDGIVVTYDEVEFSKACVPTNSKYKDGIAFKWEDDEFETRLTAIEWNTTRSGLISPVAIFKPVEIDGTMVSRATLHNVTNIKQLRLAPGCRIMVSKRNMIIPHVESNLEPCDGEPRLPSECPACGIPLFLDIGKGGESGPAENLYCSNDYCPSRKIAAFQHFVSRKALNIEGLSEASLEKLIGAGLLVTFPDIFHLDRYRSQIIRMEGFGEKSYGHLWTAIQNSRNTTFEQFLIACDIPMVGRHASAVFARTFHSDLDEFENAIDMRYRFSMLENIGMIIQDNIYNWFENPLNRELWANLKKEVTIMKNIGQNASQVTDNPFKGKTVVVTGTLAGYTRADIDAKLASIGASPSGSVSKKTDYVLVGEKPGSKLDKARALGVPIIDEAQFNVMLGE